MTHPLNSGVKWFAANRGRCSSLLSQPLPGLSGPASLGQPSAGAGDSLGGLGINLLWLSWWRIRLQCRTPGFDPWGGKIPWRRERLPTPVFWPGEFHGLYSPWGHKESDTTERLSLSTQIRLWGWCGLKWDLALRAQWAAPAVPLGRLALIKGVPAAALGLRPLRTSGVLLACPPTLHARTPVLPHLSPASVLAQWAVPRARDSSGSGVWGIRLPPQGAHI